MDKHFVAPKVVLILLNIWVADSVMCEWPKTSEVQLMLQNVVQHVTCITHFHQRGLQIPKTHIMQL